MQTREPKLIVNVARGAVVCDHCEVADAIASRTRGLLGRDLLPSGQGLLLTPAHSIHTAFMRFPIDVAFLDRQLSVIKLVSDVPPWRTARARRAAAVLELAAGEIAARSLALGDRLTLVNEAPVAHNGTEARVLLIATDRRFRSVASMLFARRGYRVVVPHRTEDIAEATAREQADVVVVDASSSLAEAMRQSAKLRLLCPAVEMVAVSDDPLHECASMALLPKWGAFGALFDAIEQARSRRTNSGVRSGTH